MENFLENKADSRVYRTPECIVLLALGSCLYQSLNKAEE